MDAGMARGIAPGGRMDARLMAVPPVLAKGPPAAVLVPVILRNEPTLLFTRRSPHLSRHPGQISFPGGMAEPGDASLTATALRETAEETGITPDYVSVAGFLAAAATGTGYAILPVVGLVREGFSLKPEAEEVAEIFELPLAFFLDPRNQSSVEREWQGQTRRFPAYCWQGREIWGATAGIIADLAQRLTP